jgi:hypothetical protein
MRSIPNAHGSRKIEAQLRREGVVINRKTVHKIFPPGFVSFRGNVLVPVEALIWICSLAIVWLIVAHVLRHVQHEPEQPAPDAVSALQPVPLALTPELMDGLHAAIAQITVSQKLEMKQTLPSAQSELLDQLIILFRCQYVLK